MCALLGCMFVYVEYFQNEHNIWFLSIFTLLVLVVAYWTGNNTNARQFERILKKVASDYSLIIMDVSAEVEIDDLIIHYDLRKKKFDKIFESNNNTMDVKVSCAFPVDGATERIFNGIRDDMKESLEKDIAKYVHYKCRRNSFTVHLELPAKYISVQVLRQIQQSFIDILIDKYHLNIIKRYLRTNENGMVYYWEFIGYEATRFVGYDAENNISDYDTGDVRYGLSDITSKATVITEEEFESAYEGVEDKWAED